MMQSCASAVKLRGGGPILFLGTKAMAQTGTPPPRTVIGDPSQADGLDRNCRVSSATSVHYAGRRTVCHLAPRPLAPAATSPFVARRRGFARLGELLRRRHRLNSVPGDRQPHRCVVAPAVVLQAQGQATQGRDLSQGNEVGGLSVQDRRQLVAAPK
jgi:hypothetical protein